MSTAGIVSILLLAGVAFDRPVYTSAQKPSPNRSFEGTYWRASELGGKPTPSQKNAREAHLIFQPGNRVAGSDGCNRITGSYQLKGDGITFGPMAGTQMACADPSGVDRAFRDVLASAARWRISGDRLELFDAKRVRIAAFDGRAPEPPQAGRLQGTGWQLVKFEGGDGRTLTAGDRTKYTIEFTDAGRVNARVDCNRGNATWKSSGANQLELGPLTLTRMACPPNPLNDQIAKQWSNIRSYTLKNGHLFLALMADGGIYEFEPLGRPKPQ